MKIILQKDDGSVEEIKYFILIACNCDTAPFIGKVISSIDNYYVPYILADYSKWQFEERLKR